MMTTFNTIGKLYLIYSLCALPASKETKRPTVQWKAYQDKLPTESEWDEWGKIAVGVCILTGKVSGCLVIIDFDDKGSRFEAWCKLLPEELVKRLVIVQTQSGGYHVYVRCEGESIRNVKLARTAEGKTLIETRGEGGLVIAPPTPGYKILSGSFEGIPNLSLNEWELLRRAAQSLDEMQHKTVPKVNSTVEIPVFAEDMIEAERLAVTYINAMPEAIEGQNGSAAALRVCNKLFEFGLDIDSAKRVFMIFYNPRCLPEWSEKEIDHKLDTAYNKPLNEAGCMLTSDIVLHPDTPLLSADKFIEAIYTSNSIPTLTFYAGDFWRWTGNAYLKIEVGEVKRRLLHFLERAKFEYRQKDANTPYYRPFPIAPGTMNSITDVLKSRIFRPISDAIPCWIGEGTCARPSSVTDTSSLIFGKDSILNLADMGTLAHSPHWFNFAVLDFDYDSNAECQKWEAFLDSIFTNDEDAKQTLMEWIGLCLTPITKFQKALFLIGPKRSGKGTIARILQKVVGYQNSVAPATSDFGKDFGLQPFIGKTLAVISDARFAKGSSSQITERILNITGEDMITINRKHREAVTLRLQTKLTFISNEIPSILDQSGALASRFIFLKLPKSFFGKEDVELENKLSSELSGILRLAIQHLQVLLKRGRFVQPESGKRLAERMMALSSPISDFAKQLLPGMSREEIWNQWADYCFTEGQGLGVKNVLWNNLESAGYNCDFETADILAIIQKSDGEATVRMIYDGKGKNRVEGGADRLRRKLAEMVDAGKLTVEPKKAKNGHMVDHYRIAGEKLDDAYDEFC